LQALFDEFFAALNVGIGGVADHHARRLKALRRDAGQAIGFPPARE
jgi:hypothetical protein